jgi:hypothetical protein
MIQPVRTVLDSLWAIPPYLERGVLKGPCRSLQHVTNNRRRACTPLVLFTSPTNSYYLHQLIVPVLFKFAGLVQYLDYTHDIFNNMRNEEEIETDSRSLRSNDSGLYLGEDDRQYLDKLKDRDYVVTKNTRHPLGLFSVVAFILQQVIGDFPSI